MNGRRNEPPNVKGRHIHQHPSASSHPSLNENAASQHLDKNGTNNSHNSHNNIDVTSREYWSIDF